MTNRPTKLYISGPMTGLPDDNVPMFDAAAERLRDRGFVVVNPADIARANPHLDPLVTWGYNELIRLDLEQIPACDGLAMLRGWQESNGALMERAEARKHALHINTVMYWEFIHTPCNDGG